MLLSSSNGSGDHGKNKITFHHNWWAENVAERMPRVRFGEVHIFNNLYVATPDFTYYAIRCGYDANVRSEKNIYKDFSGTSPLYDGGAVTVFNYFDGSKKSVLETVDDVFVNCTDRVKDADGVEGGTFGNGTAFTPPYDYTTGSTDTLEAAVLSGAGPTLQVSKP
jgi:pectate lyase